MLWAARTPAGVIASGVVILAETTLPVGFIAVIQMIKKRAELRAGIRAERDVPVSLFRLAYAAKLKDSCIG